MLKPHTNPNRIHSHHPSASPGLLKTLTPAHYALVQPRDAHLQSWHCWTIVFEPHKTSNLYWLYKLQHDTEGSRSLFFKNNKMFTKHHILHIAHGRTYQLFQKDAVYISLHNSYILTGQFTTKIKLVQTLPFPLHVRTKCWVNWKDAATPQTQMT